MFSLFWTCISYKKEPGSTIQLGNLFCMYYWSLCTITLCCFGYYPFLIISVSFNCRMDLLLLGPWIWPLHLRLDLVVPVQLVKLNWAIIPLGRSLQLLSNSPLRITCETMWQQWPASMCVALWGLFRGWQWLSPPPGWAHMQGQNHFPAPLKLLLWHDGFPEVTGFTSTLLSSCIIGKM